MHRFRWIALVVVVALVGVGTSLGAATKAALRVTSTSPVRVAGRGFHARERVRVVFSTDSTHRTATVRASVTGSFTAAAGASTLPFDPCSDTLRVTATGSDGSRAATKLPARECPPAA